MQSLFYIIMVVSKQRRMKSYEIEVEANKYSWLSEMLKEKVMQMLFVQFSPL